MSSFFSLWKCNQNLVFLFLFSCGHEIYKRLCPSVRRFIHPSVGPSVRWSICPPVRNDCWKVRKRAFLNLQLWLSVWVSVCGLGKGRVWMRVTRPPVRNYHVTPRFQLIVMQTRPVAQCPVEFKPSDWCNHPQLATHISRSPITS